MLSKLNEAGDSKFAHSNCVSCSLTDAGANVYMYEFQHRPNVFKDSRPSFVMADHADDVCFVFGACFWNGHVTVIGTYVINLNSKLVNIT